MPPWVVEAYQIYSRRLPKDCAFELIEIPAAKRGRSLQSEVWIKKEGDLILKKIAHSDWVVALDIEGESWKTSDLAKQITKWQSLGRNVALLVGGPDGLSSACIRRANQCWSLSALTLPHPLVRVVLSEAIYRAWSLTVNHPYHRE